MINAPELAGEMIRSERPKAALGAYSLLTLARLPSFRTSNQLDVDALPIYISAIYCSDCTGMGLF